MPDLPLLPCFVLATTVLMLIPGPNVALIVAASASRGTQSGLLTVAGTASAMVPQLVLVAFGPTGLLGTLGREFELLRWIGAAYLVVLGVRQWRAAPGGAAGSAPPARSPGRFWLRGFLVSAFNPKTLIFYGAFFPQFLPNRGAGPARVWTLCALFLLVAVLVDGGWALAAGRARVLLTRHDRFRRRLAGGVLVGAGLGLALARAR